MKKWLTNILCLVFILQGTCVFAEVSQEYQLKAAIIFNFARFINWPDRAEPPDGERLNFCVVGRNPFENILEALEQKKIKGHPVKVQYMSRLTEDGQCHLAFFSADAAEHIAAYSEKLKAGATITVSDYPGFIDAGGDIELTRLLDRLRFNINNTGLKEKGLQASSSLLQIAEKVF